MNSILLCRPLARSLKLPLCRPALTQFRRCYTEGRTTRRDDWWKDSDDRRSEGSRRGTATTEGRERRGYEHRDRDWDSGYDRRDTRRDDRRGYDRSEYDRRDRRDDWRDDTRDDRGGSRRDDQRMDKRDDRKRTVGEQQHETGRKREGWFTKEMNKLANEEAPIKEVPIKEVGKSQPSSKERPAKKEKRVLLPFFPPSDIQPSERKPLMLFKDKAQLSKHQWILSNQVASVGYEYEAGSLVDVYSRDEILLGQAYINPVAKIFGRFVSWAPETVERLDQDYFTYRITQAYKRRRKAMPDSDKHTEFLHGRLVNAEGDFMPGLIIERYGDTFVVQTKTYTMDKKFALIKAALATLFDAKTIIERNDFASREAEGLQQKRVLHLLDESKSEQVVVDEQSEEDTDVSEEPARIAEDGHGVVTIVETHPGGVSAKFKIDAWHGQKTGYYFDQQFNRSLLRNFAKGKSVLDLYCYVGSWSIFAKKYGAKYCIGVDTSSLAIQNAEKSAELNGLDDLEWRQGDVEEVLDSLKAENHKFDLIIVDPPALVPKKNHFYQGFKKYLDIHQKAIALLPSGGILFSCSCSYHMSEEPHLELLQRAAEKTGKNISILARGGLPHDHPVDVFTPESDYLTCYVVQVN